MYTTTIVAGEKENDLPFDRCVEPVVLSFHTWINLWGNSSILFNILRGTYGPSF